MLMFATSIAAAQSFVCNDLERVVDVAPAEVTCVAALDEPYDRIEWLNGLGDILEGARFTTQYTEPGQYSVHMYVEGYGLEGDDVSLRRDGAVTVCGVPEPEFDIIDKGGRVYEVVNRTEVLLLCIDNVEWTVHEGGEDGPIVASFPIWQPSFALDEDGDYTVTLAVEGRAGTAALSVPLEAEYGLTEQFYARRSQSCSTAGPSLSWLWCLLPPLLIIRRPKG